MNDIIADLRAIEQKSRQIAHQIGRMVPEEPERNDLTQEAYIRACGITSEATRAIRALRQAIRKELGG